MTISVVPPKKSAMSINSRWKKRRIDTILPSKAALKVFYGKSIDCFFNAHLAPYKHPVERGIWLFVHIVATFGMILVIYQVTSDYKRSPTVITKDLKEYSIQDIDFPGVAICNINRISKRALVELAQELLEFQSTTFNRNLTLVELVEMLKYLGNLYHFKQTPTDLEVAKLLHTILERGYNGYDIVRIMKRLTPKCRHMLQKCSWGGRVQVCDDIFSLRRTQEGYCCIFNYGRRHTVFGSEQNEIFPSQSTERAKNAGPEYGLSVLLNPETEDYAYNILPGLGFKVLVFAFNSYPATFSGGVRELVVSPKTEAFLNMHAVPLYSVPDVIQYDVLQRDCLFNSEKSAIFQGYYSFNECIMHCRIEDVLRACKCVPFFLPLVNTSARACNLKDLFCLKRYGGKWGNLKPRLEYPMVPFNYNFGERYLDCDCYPSCEDVIYWLSMNSIPLTIPTITWDSESTFVLKNHSILHVNFGDGNVIKLRQDVLYYWYELVSNYGGICNLFLGVSFINILEVFYLLLKQFFKSPRVSTADVKETKPVPKLKISVVQPVTFDSPPLYWHEISCPNRINFNVPQNKQ